MVESVTGNTRQNRQLRVLAYDAMYRDETGTAKTCRDCGVIFAARPWHRVRTVGHNIPLSRVRENETRELVKYDQCAGCNADQGTRTPEEWRLARAAGEIEAIRELTDEQLRIRARVRWEGQFRRRQSERKTKTIPLDKVPEHLLSHDESYRLELDRAKGSLDWLPGQIAKDTAELARHETSLSHFASLPKVRRYFFGLVTRTDHARTSLVAQYERSVSETRELLECHTASLAEARARLLRLRRDRGLSECSCVACTGNFEARAADFAEERARERRARWSSRAAASSPSRQYRSRGRWR